MPKVLPGSIELPSDSIIAAKVAAEEQGANKENRRRKRHRDEKVTTLALEAMAQKHKEEDNSEETSAGETPNSPITQMLQVERRGRRAKEIVSWLFTLGGMTNDAAFAAANMAMQIAVFSKKAISDIPKGLLYGLMSLAACLSSFIEIVVYKESVFESLSNFNMIGKEHLAQITETLVLDFETKADNTLAFETFSPLKNLIDALNQHNDIRPKTKIEYKKKNEDIKSAIKTINGTINTLDVSNHTPLEALGLIYAIDNIEHRRQVASVLIQKVSDFRLASFYERIEAINTLNHDLSHDQAHYKQDKKKIKGVKELSKEDRTKQLLNLTKKHNKKKEDTEQDIRQKGIDLIALFENETLYDQASKKILDERKLQLLLIDLISSDNEKDYILKCVCKNLRVTDKTLSKRIATKKWFTGIFARFIVPLMVAPSVFFGCVNVCSMIFASSTPGILVFSYVLSLLAAVAVTLYISNEIAKVIAQNKPMMVWRRWIAKLKKLQKEKADFKVFLHFAIPIVILGSVITACAFGLSSYVTYAVNGLQMLWASMPAAATVFMTISSWFYMIGDIAGFTLMNMLESFNKISLKEMKEFFSDRLKLLKEQFVDDTKKEFAKVKESKTHPPLKPLLYLMAAISVVIDAITAMIETILMPLIFVGHLISTSLTFNGNKDAAKSIAVTASASFNEGAQDLCFLHGHPNPVSTAFRFLFYVGPVFISNLFKSLIPFKKHKHENEAAHKHTHDHEHSSGDKEEHDHKHSHGHKNEDEDEHSDAHKEKHDHKHTHDHEPNHKHPKNYASRFSFLMQKEWKNVTTGRKHKAHAFLEHDCSSH